MLRFTPAAWAKLAFLRDAGPTEIGGFGVSSATDPLLIEDARLLNQQCDPESVLLDDDAVADYFDDMVDQGIPPERFSRVWLHTHPGNSPLPSRVDEETFRRVFGPCRWSIMFILARGGATYARLQVDAGVRLSVVIEVAIDYESHFVASDHPAWQSEYDTHVESLAPPAIEPLDAWSEHDAYRWELAGQPSFEPAEAATGWDPFVERRSEAVGAGEEGAADDNNG